jgi:DNA repair photolyase
VAIKEIQAKSILRKQKKIESWFICRYGMNLYRGCSHNCVYCDGRSEKYQVEGKFGEDVVVKINALELLKRELDEKRKSIIKSGYVMVGGGVGDSYQPIEKKYKLTQQTLQFLYEKNYSVHILTKSTLVERDIELIKKINKKSKAIVSFSFSSADDKISTIFEPGVPPPSERLKTISRLKNEGIPTGMFLLPVIPFITDLPSVMSETIKKAHDAGVDFIVFGGMTLKEGGQMQYFYNVLKKYYPDLLVDYSNIYKGSKWGNAVDDYYKSTNILFSSIVKNYKIPKRIPPELFRDILTENDLVIVILEHIDYLLKIKGFRSPYGYAAYMISKLTIPLSKMKGDIRKIKGVGEKTEKLILEILETKTSSYYENLLVN